MAYITVDITFCLLYSFCVVFFFFWAAVSAFALLSCSIVLLLHILNCFIELINDDDDDDDDFGHFGHAILITQRTAELTPLFHSRLSVSVALRTNYSRELMAVSAARISFSLHRFLMYTGQVGNNGAVYSAMQLSANITCQLTASISVTNQSH